MPLFYLPIALSCMIEVRKVNIWGEGDNT